MKVLLALLVAAVAATAAERTGAQAPATARDGMIVFERRSGTGVADIWAVRPDGSSLRRLTRTQDAFDPELSPDGRSVVFASHRTHGPGATELFVMRSDGTRVRRLTRNAHTRDAFTIDADPTWSPDGRTIVFSRTTVRGGRASTDLFAVGVGGGTPRRLTDAAGDEVSPTFGIDSSDLVFVRGGYVWRRLGAEEIRLFRGADPDWTRAHDFPAWSRDGHVYRATRAGTRRVARGTDPVWAPDGRRLAWTTARGLVVDGRSITRPPGLVHDVSPSWGPAR